MAAFNWDIAYVLGCLGKTAVGGLGYGTSFPFPSHQNIGPVCHDGYVKFLSILIKPSVLSHMNKCTPNSTKLDMGSFEDIFPSLLQLRDICLGKDAAGDGAVGVLESCTSSAWSHDSFLIDVAYPKLSKTPCETFFPVNRAHRCCSRYNRIIL